jgi:hypothetical protein
MSQFELARAEFELARLVRELSPSRSPTEKNKFSDRPRNKKNERLA